MNIKEISEIAGFSQAAVSLALNNKPGVSEETRRKILEIAKQEGYSKKTNGQKGNILFVKYIGCGMAIEQNGDFITTVIDSIEQTSSSLGYNLVIKNIMASEFDAEIKSINLKEYEGIIFLGTEANEEDVSILWDIDIPVVVVDNMFENHNIDAIVMDNRGGIYRAIKYLSSLGHNKIGYLDSTERFSNFDQRTESYVKTIKELKLKDNKEYIRYVTPTLEGAYIDMLKQLKSGIELPTAFVAANDTIAIGAVKAFKEFGLDIPRQVSIIGFDDIPFGRMLDKALTTMSVNKVKLGKMAINVLDKKINDFTDECMKILLTTKLVQRESVHDLTQIINGN